MRGWRRAAMMAAAAASWQLSSGAQSATFNLVSYSGRHAWSPKVSYSCSARRSTTSASSSRSASRDTSALPSSLFLLV